MNQTNANQVELTTKKLQVPGAELSYSITGDPAAPTLVFIPGWGGSIDFFQSQLEHFKSDFRILLLEFPGFGRSSLKHSKPSGGNLFRRLFGKDKTLSANRLGEYVVQVLAKERIRECTIIGHSFGGALALIVAGLKPDIVKRVVGADSLTYLSIYPAVSTEVIEEFAAGFRADFKPAARALAESYFLEGADPDKVNWVADAMADTDPETGIAILECVLAWDLDEALNAFDGPINVIAASGAFERDAFTLRYGERIHVSTLDDVGHFVMLDDPDGFNARLSQIL